MTGCKRYDEVCGPACIQNLWAVPYCPPRCCVMARCSQREGSKAEPSRDLCLTVAISAFLVTCFPCCTTPGPVLQYTKDPDSPPHAMFSTDSLETKNKPGDNGVEAGTSPYYNINTGEPVATHALYGGQPASTACMPSAT
jgi:hypothetical protein